MEDNMDGAVDVDEQYSWMLSQFSDILVKNSDIGMKIQDMQDRILVLKKEQQRLLNRHEKLTEASNLLELLCKAFQSANKKMWEEGISQVKAEWEGLKTTSGNPEDSPMAMLIERIRKINFEPDESKPFAQGVSSVGQKRNCCYDKKKLLAAEMELGWQFSPALSVLEDDLINQNKLLRLERAQLEEKVKRTLATFARIKLDLSRYESDFCRLQNILQKSSNALWVPTKVEIKKMAADVKDIEKNNTAMFCQWQGHHNVLCGILDDVRMFNTQAVKITEKIWHLCRICKHLNGERLELIYRLIGGRAQGHN